jgi:hypothetical protein
MLDLAAANWNTALGAACFLTCALAGLRTVAYTHSDDAIVPART